MSKDQELSCPASWSGYQDNSRICFLKEDYMRYSTTNTGFYTSTAVETAFPYTLGQQLGPLVNGLVERKSLEGVVRQV